MTTTGITTDNQAEINPEFIPAAVAESTGQAALDGFLRFKQYLQKHPDEERAFQAKVAEVRNRYGK